ncbi:tyrosine-type recombinase/integrase [Oceaniglobus indicus]|uniref:tyrosine-type recombinase/integrase n=1 Tax=Oceaniglobus indicus TaxID=2047749 RepID=UPI0011AB4AFE|nr:site-specific integrase [Oceaniglobus indicus]
MGKKPGPHVEKRLTPAFIKKASPGRHTDGGGLYLSVSPTGAKRWVARLTINGHRRDYGLGPAHTISLAKAREIAAEYREAAYLGLDPRFTIGRKDKALTFEEAAEQTHADLIKTKGKNGKHKDQWINTLRTYAYPSIGKMNVAHIESGDIVRLLKPIWDTKHETARRVKQRIGVVFNWAKVHNYRTAENPVPAIEAIYRTDKRKAGHFSAVPWRKADTIFQEMRAKADNRETEPVGLLALQFTILTASRSGPVRFARWDHLDTQAEEEWATCPHWHIPGELMKTGQDFTIPLSKAAQTLLAEWRKQAPKSDLIFPSPQNPRKPLSDATMRKALQEFAPGMTVHGWRSTFRDWLAEGAHGVEPHVADAALAHGRTKTDAAYHRAAYFEQRIFLMEAWSRYLLESQDDLTTLAQIQMAEEEAFQRYAEQEVEKEGNRKAGLMSS